MQHLAGCRRLAADGNPLVVAAPLDDDVAVDAHRAADWFGEPVSRITSSTQHGGEIEQAQYRAHWREPIAEFWNVCEVCAQRTLSRRGAPSDLSGPDQKISLAGASLPALRARGH